ncbi:hypothetical protein OG21DRAFT_1522905 [Imleria badia]|nr:hypothetical protein OG21DRAFT_1522905 [Imleria badia]
MSDAQAEGAKLGGDRSSDVSGSQQPAIFERPTGWRRIYYHPVLQVALLGFVCFMPWWWTLNTKDQANANAALYATFAFFGFFSGTINNFLGPRLTRYQYLAREGISGHCNSGFGLVIAFKSAQYDGV